MNNSISTKNLSQEPDNFTQTQNKKHYKNIMFEVWAPFWEFYESQQFNTKTIDKLMNIIRSPVLLVGSGQGLVASHLKKMGIVVWCVDLEKEMLKAGLQKRNIKGIAANASFLPFRDGYFKTVLISTGVIDYSNNNEEIQKIFNEALRVAGTFASIIVAFYKLLPSVEKIYKRIGIIDENGKFFFRRIFELTIDLSPDRCIQLIEGWTGKPWTKSAFAFVHAGWTLPRRLRTDRKMFNRAIELAKLSGKNIREIIEAVPEKIPLRKEKEIMNLFESIGVREVKLDIHDECITATYYKSPLKSIVISNLPIPKKSPAIVVKNLIKTYTGSKIPALNGINLSVEKGSIWGLLGPNGAGKTTTIMILLSLIKPDSGIIQFFRDGEQIDMGKIRKIAGYVPQELALYQKLTAKENLEYFAGLYGLDDSERKKRVDETLLLLGLSERANDKVLTFSSGMKRRLNFAAGIVNNPEFLILDEPTVGVDPQSRNCIFETIIEMKKKGTTIIYTTHYMEEAEKLCDTVAVMDHGRILIEGEPSNLVSKYGISKLIFEVKNGNFTQEFLQTIRKMKNITGVDVEKEKLTVYLFSGAESNLYISQKIVEEARITGNEIILKSIIEPSLESLFLDITGRNLRDEYEL